MTHRTKFIEYYRTKRNILLFPVFALVFMFFDIWVGVWIMFGLMVIYLFLLEQLRQALIEIEEEETK